MHTNNDNIDYYKVEPPAVIGGGGERGSGACGAAPILRSGLPACLPPTAAAGPPLPGRPRLASRWDAQGAPWAPRRGSETVVIHSLFALLQLLDRFWGLWGDFVPPRAPPGG